MRRAWLLPAIFALEVAAAHAAPRTPCDRVEAPAVEALAERLARSDDPAAWRSVLAAGADAAVADAFSARDRACAAYVAGSAAFFLSADRKDGRRFAVAAVGHFARAEALAPDGMSGRQPRSRLNTAWRRLGAVPGWLQGSRPLPFALPAGPAGTVRLSPADPDAWADICPGEACAVRVEVPRGDGGSTVSLRPGLYRVAHVGPCGVAEVAVELEGGVLPIPAPAVCTAALVVRDGDAPIEGWRATIDGEPVDGAALPVETAVEVSAPGYVAQTVTAPPQGGPLAVELARCPVTLEVRTLPASATVEGAGPGPWGTRTVRATAPGHGPVQRTVEVSRPGEGCAGTERVAFELPRPISVVATDHQGKPVSVAKLLVQGEQVDPVGLFRVSGRYGLQAMHPTLGAVTEKFEVTPCDGEDCGPVRVEVRFPPPADAGSGIGSTLAYTGGSVMLVVGALAAIGAFSANADIQRYRSKAEDRVALQDLVDQRDKAALAADVMLLGGGGLMWLGWWLDEDDE